MSKVSKKQIDIDEGLVIADLQKNARESVDNIAKRCGFSRQKVWRTIKRLEKDHTIWGYHAVVDQSKLDLKRYLILLKRLPNHMKKESLDKMVKGKLKGMAEIGVVIDSSFFVHGMYDWVLNVTANNIRQIKKFCGILEKTLSGHLSDMYRCWKYCSPLKKTVSATQIWRVFFNDFFLTEDEARR